MNLVVLRKESEVILDICLGIILILSIVTGYGKGFTESFLHTIGWLLAIVLGFVWTPAVAAFLRANTEIEETLRQTLARRLADLSDGIGEGISSGLDLGASQNAADSTASAISLPFFDDGILLGIPRVLADYFSDAASVIGTNTVDNLASIIITILALLLIIVIIKLIFFFILLIFSKKKRKGIIGLSDGILGAAFGAVKGFLLICILLAFFLPLANFMQSDVLLEQLYASTYAIRIYDNNPIFFLTQLFF
jgi:uncharacterized membrane protein required for colicin V production